MGLERAEGWGSGGEGGVGVSDEPSVCVWGVCK